MTSSRILQIILFIWQTQELQNKASLTTYNGDCIEITVCYENRVTSGRMQISFWWFLGKSIPEIFLSNCAWVEIIQKLTVLCFLALGITITVLCRHLQVKQFLCIIPFSWSLKQMLFTTSVWLDNILWEQLHSWKYEWNLLFFQRKIK